MGPFCPRCCGRHCFSSLSFCSSEGSSTPFSLCTFFHARGSFSSFFFLYTRVVLTPFFFPLCDRGAVTAQSYLEEQTSYNLARGCLTAGISFFPREGRKTVLFLLGRPQEQGPCGLGSPPKPVTLLGTFSPVLMRRAKRSPILVVEISGLFFPFLRHLMRAHVRDPPWCFIPRSGCTAFSSFFYLRGFGNTCSPCVILMASAPEGDGFFLRMLSLDLSSPVAGLPRPPSSFSIGYVRMFQAPGP